jgi:cytochrome c oxidase assembly protein subunit 15
VNAGGWVSERMLRGLALASVVANVGIVVTGGAVRLTGSGLGCPTWPRCTDSSYVTTAAMGGHGLIEFTNRTLAGVLSVIVIAGVLAALLVRPRRRRVVVLATLTLLGIPAQIVLGGITVLTHLNPWVVGGHFLLSIAVIAAAYAFWRATREGDGPARAVVPVPLRTLAATVVAAVAAVVVVGTVVTGSGPHAGDEFARRTGLDPAGVAQVHADLVFLVVGLAVAGWLALLAVGARAPARRAGWLVAVVFGQGLIGFVQYATGLPAILVGAHLLGACLVWLAALSLWSATRTRAPLTVDPADRSPAPEALERATVVHSAH